MKLVSAATALALAIPASAQTINVDLISVADTYIRDDATDRGTFEFVDIRGGFNPDFHGYFRFDLPND
ncbi:MAG: hypothetical protein ACLFR7_08175, partial [Opitutales bacterium]